MPIQIGRVLISSGKAISATNSSLDWAFVEIDVRNNQVFDNPDRNFLPLAESISITNHAKSYNTNLKNYDPAREKTRSKVSVRSKKGIGTSKLAEPRT